MALTYARLTRCGIFDAVYMLRRTSKPRIISCVEPLNQKPCRTVMPVNQKNLEAASQLVLYLRRTDADHLRIRECTKGLSSREPG